jgi:hypothetical protein
MITANAAQFEGMLSSVIQSQDAEVILGKQPIFAEYGREVRSAVNALPPEVSRSLLNEYREPAAQLVSSIEEAIISRELAIENATQEAGLDQQWLAGGGAGRKINEADLSAEDSWNQEPGM